MSTEPKVDLSRERVEKVAITLCSPIPNKMLLALLDAKERAEAELSEARNKISTCDDVRLDVPLANSIADLRARLEAADHVNRQLKRWDVVQEWNCEDGYHLQEVEAPEGYWVRYEDLVYGPLPP